MVIISVCVVTTARGPSKRKIKALDYVPVEIGDRIMEKNDTDWLFKEEEDDVDFSDAEADA